MIKNRQHRPNGYGWYAINDRADDAPPAAGEPKVADIYIYAEIGDSWFGDSVTAGQFVKDVAGLDVDKINLHLNSPGGDVFDAIAIANVIRQHEASTTVTVDGLAASAASFIAMAGDELVMGKNSELMIHDAWGICIGNAKDMVKLADLLDHESDNIASMYQDKAGGTVEFWRDAMRDETWYSASEAVDAGLADRVLASENKEAEKTKSRFDLSIFAHAGRAEAPPPKIPVRLNRNVKDGFPNVRVSKGEYLIPASKVPTLINANTGTTTPVSPAEPVRNPNPTTEGADTMSDTLTTGLRERLGIPDDAELDDDGLLTALDEKLTEQPEPTNHAPELPQGTVMIEQSVLDNLRASAELGRAAREQQLTSERNAIVDAAVQDGRIAPARRDHWIQALVADPGSADVLASLAPGTIPVAPIGYTGGVEESNDDDRLFAKLYGTEAH